jgi:hypothetical protein
MMNKTMITLDKVFGGAGIINLPVGISVIGIALERGVVKYFKMNNDTAIMAIKIRTTVLIDCSKITMATAKAVNMKILTTAAYICTLSG